MAPPGTFSSKGLGGILYLRKQEIGQLKYSARSKLATSGDKHVVKGGGTVDEARASKL